MSGGDGRQVKAKTYLVACDADQPTTERVERELTRMRARKLLPNVWIHHDKYDVRVRKKTHVEHGWHACINGGTQKLRRPVLIYLLVRGPF